MRVAVVTAVVAALSIAVGASSFALAQGKKAVPKGKNPPGVNPTHFQCYGVTEDNRKDGFRDTPVRRGDQFKQDWEQKVGKAVLLCNPIFVKDGVPYERTRTHLVCYEVEPLDVKGKVGIRNQFGESDLTLGGGAKLLCVPSLKAVPRDLVLDRRTPARP